MASLRDAVQDAVTSTACTLLGAASTYARNFEGILGAIAPDVGLPVASPASGLSAAYGLLCDRPPPPLQNPPPFTGGQCVGTSYTIAFTVDFVTGVTPPNTEVATPESGSLVRTGAILSFQIENNDTSCGYRLVTTTGSEFIGRATFPTFNKNELRNLRGLTVTPNFGQPDNCGDPDPDPIIPDPDPTGDDIDITYENNEGDTITNNFNITFGSAYLDIDSQINLPVTITNNDDSDFSINANLNFNSGNLNFYVGNPAYPPGSGRPPKDSYKPGGDLPPVPPSVVAPIPVPFPPDGEAQTEDIIAAVMVTVDEIPPDITQIFQGENPDIFAPNLGYLNFAVAVGETSAWTADIPVKNLRQFVPCPWDAGAIDVKGTPRPGVNWTITPVYLTRTVVDA